MYIALTLVHTFALLFSRNRDAKNMSKNIKDAFFDILSQYIKKEGTHPHAHTHTHVHACTHTHTYTRTCTHTHKHTHTHTHTHIIQLTYYQIHVFFIFLVELTSITADKILMKMRESGHYVLDLWG